MRCLACLLVNIVTVLPQYLSIFMPFLYKHCLSLLGPLSNSDMFCAGDLGVLASLILVELPDSWDDSVRNRAYYELAEWLWVSLAGARKRTTSRRRFMTNKLNHNWSASFLYDWEVYWLGFNVSELGFLLELSWLKFLTTILSGNLMGSRECTRCRISIW